MRSEKRAGATHCSARCRLNAHRYNKALAELPAEITALHALLSAVAPEHAVSYRVSLDADLRRIRYFPASDQPSPRWDGSRSSRPYFRLRPLEPPIVPQAAIYGLLLLDGSGCEVPTPVELAAGVPLVPLLDVEVAGDPWIPTDQWSAAPGHRIAPRCPRRPKPGK